MQSSSYKMSNILIVSEKPSSAEKIAESLGKSVKKQGYFEVRQGKDLIYVAPAVGHLYTLVQKEKSSKFPVFDLKWVETPQASEHFQYAEKYLTVLKKLAKLVDKVVIACDYDIEGELIGYNIWRFIAPKLPAKRMHFSTLTKEELQESFANPGEVPIPFAQAGEARHMLDWFFGINMSRALMSAIKSAGRFKVMSIGRVQGPALAILSQREKEVIAFIPVPYWQVFADVNQVQFVHEKDRFSDKTQAEQIVLTTPKKGEITNLKKSISQLAPPHPHDLTTLQMDSYAAFGFTPAKTLELAQFLYENAFISYPRTSSQQLSEKLNLKKIVSLLTKQPKYAADAEKILKTKMIPNNGKKTDAAHPPIHPTGLPPAKLNDQHAKLYELIVRNFLACFAEPAKRESVSVVATFGEQKFKTSGSRTVYGGWLDFFPFHDVKDTVVDFEQGQKVEAKKIYLEDKETKPPNRFSPASIVKKLEDLNLGTKATRAEVIETLYSRDYIADKKSIHVTEFGLCVYDALAMHCPGLLKPELTQVFEEQMEEIEQGKATVKQVVDGGQVTVTALCKEFKEHEVEIGKHLLTSLNFALTKAAELGNCKCGGKLLIRHSKFGQFVGCSAYPACHTLFPLPHKAFIIPTEKICDKCHTPIIGVRRKEKKFFSMCLDPKCETKANWGNKNSTSSATSSSSASPTVVVSTGVASNAGAVRVASPVANIVPVSNVKKKVVVKKPRSSTKSPKKGAVK